jgi:hypothetical protein
MNLKNPNRITASALGIYAGLIGIQHGIFEILQGPISPNGLLINAIGAPCQPGEIWHACFPALTIIPNYYVTGFLAVIVSLTVLIWSAGFVNRKYGGLVLILLSSLMLLVGGGFIPTFIGSLAGITATRINTAPKWMEVFPEHALRFLSKLWPWTIVTLLMWLPFSWFLGYFFNHYMLKLSFLIFFGLDIVLPLLTVVSSFAYKIIEDGSSVE